MELGRLRFYLHGDHLQTFPLYELLMNHTVQVVLRATDLKNSPAVTLTPEEALHAVGFGLDEGLVHYPRQAFPGYRLLTEFFAYPFKFLFIDVAGWDRVRALGPARQVELLFFVNRTNTRLEQALDASMFRLGCT